MGKKSSQNDAAYDHAITQASKDKFCDHLKHDDIQEQLIESFKKHEGFKELVVHALKGSPKFWCWMIGLVLVICLAVSKSPELAAWITSFILGTNK